MLLEEVGPRRELHEPVVCHRRAHGPHELDDSLEGEAYRWHLVGQYRIFYTHSAETLTVWRILHTRQDLDGYALIDWGE